VCFVFAACCALCLTDAWRLLQVLFCGVEFGEGFARTAAALAGDARFAVTRCAREELEAHIGDADMAVRLRGQRLRRLVRVASDPSCAGAGARQVPLMARIDAPLLARAPRLRYVLQFGVGLEARCAACR
jgi:hypothetical protein